MGNFYVDFRQKFPQRMQLRYEAYWHRMHPVTFNPMQLYQLGFTPEEWDALTLIRERRGEIISGSRWWNYQCNLSGLDNRPEYVPKDARLQFEFDNDGRWDLPRIKVEESELPSVLRDRLRDWIFVAYFYKSQSELLRSKLRSLLQQHHEYYDHNNRSVKKALVNTPGTLVRVWPEIRPFLSDFDKQGLIGRKMKSPLPKDWDEKELAAFHEGEPMAQLTDSLSIMSLIDKDRDEFYPSLSD